MTRDAEIVGGTVAAIRTHVWTDQEERLAGLLRPVFGARLCAVVHNRAEGVQPSVPVVDLTNDWVKAHGLRAVGDYGWRCGDYSLYALRAARPGADHYWLIEPDVHFTGDVSDFFTRTEEYGADLLGVERLFVKEHHRFAQSLAIPAWRSVFALMRISGRAIDYLLPLRQAYSAKRVPARSFANDEVFVWSHLMADDRFTTAELRQIVPDWFSAHRFRADPDILLEALAQETASQVWHPVQSRPHFLRAVAGRVAASLAYLERMHASLVHLSDAELAEMTNEISNRVAEALHRSRARALDARARAETRTQPALGDVEG